MEEYPTQNIQMSQKEVDRIFFLIELTQPQEIVSIEQLQQIGPYSFAQVRMAIAQMAITRVNPKERLWTRESTKPLEGGNKAILQVKYPIDKQSDIPQSITLTIMGHGKFIIEFCFPIMEPQDWIDVGNIRYSDFRTKPHKFTFLYDMRKKGATIGDIQRLWEGLRFLCRNIREWDKQGITLPENV